MGLFSSDTESLEPKWQRYARAGLMQTAQPAATERLQRAGEAYPGQLVAGMSGAEQTSQDLLAEYLKSQPSTTSPLFQAAEQELTQTLGGQTYDPVEGTYYQAYRNAVLRELQDATDRLAARTSASDQFFGGGRIAEEGRLQEGATNTLALELGRLSEAERARRLGAVEPALALSQYKEQAPLTRVAAGQEYGALPREIEQAELDAAYVEWNRQLADLGLALDVYTGMLTYQPPQTVQSSGLGNALTGAMLGGTLVGPWGALIGGAAGALA